jgi:mRNA interferase RelE/StbE
VYRVLYDTRIEKDLRPIPQRDRETILRRIEKLSTQPRLHGVEKLEGVPGYRLRSGDYRILFTVNDPAKSVTIYRIKHRREVYR